MSKIRIKGDTSGYVDLETSASGSNLSIGGNTTVTGDVAINGQLTTTSLGTTLSSNSYNVVKIQTDKDDTSAADGLLQFTHGSANTVKGEIRYDASESMFELGHGDNQGHIRINASGYVTMPNKPVFSYLGSKSHVISTTGDQVMSSSNVWSASVNHGLNRGSHFNASNGRFTAPVTGTYAFYFKCQASNLTSGYLWFYFKVNGSTKSYAQKSQEAAHTAMTHHMIFELSASDYVTSEWTNNYVSGQIHYPSFSGHLIG